MKMDGDIMKMRAVQGGLDLPAGKTVELKPGGYHVMLMDLKAALPKDSTVPLTLVFKDAKGVESKVELKLPVSTMAPGGKMGDMPDMDHSKMPMDHSMHKKP
jgi:copper(I)-binding protein